MSAGLRARARARLANVEVTITREPADLDGEERPTLVIDVGVWCEPTRHYGRDSQPENDSCIVWATCDGAPIELTGDEEAEALDRALAKWSTGRVTVIDMTAPRMARAGRGW